MLYIRFIREYNGEIYCNLCIEWQTTYTISIRFAKTDEKINKYT